MHTSSQAGLASFAHLAVIIPTVTALVHPTALVADAITSVPLTMGLAA